MSNVRNEIDAILGIKKGIIKTPIKPDKVTITKSKYTEFEEYLFMIALDNYIKSYNINVKRNPQGKNAMEIKEMKKLLKRMRHESSPE